MLVVVVALVGVELEPSESTIRLLAVMNGLAIDPTGLYPTLFSIVTPFTSGVSTYMASWAAAWMLFPETAMFVPDKTSIPYTPIVLIMFP